jgi:HEAT repeat protein
VLCGLLLVLLTLRTVPADAQAGAAEAGSTRSVLLAQGWTALSQGQLARASSAAQQVLNQSPRDAGGVALAVEVEIARGGAAAGLDAYERWLGAKNVDAAYVLRRVASAYLDSAAHQQQSVARLHALKALMDDGDAEAAAALNKAVAAGGVAESRVVASSGNVRAVKVLIAQLQTMPDTRGTMKALADSGSELAVPPLVAMLSDPNDDNRAGAADALGRLGARGAIDQLKPLLNDRNFTVKLNAASALYRLDDNTGAQLLDQLLASEHPAIQLAAAEALSVRPGGAWQNVVRVLTGNPDQLIQLTAARLIAPYDRELAESVLERLRLSENLAIREEAVRVLADKVANDFRTLRRLLRTSDATTVVTAADRILELTR